VLVAVLQGDIDQGVKWSADWAERTLEIYEGLTHQAVARGARVVVWPETAVPGSPDADGDLRARLETLARETRAVLVVGGVGVRWLRSPGRAPYQVFDSGFVFDADGHLRSRYDKTHLVPFGEYLPLRGLIGRFVRAVATGSAGIDVSAGAAPRAVALRVGDRTLPVGIPICYELLFPNLVRRFVDDGARVLLAITNDAWYGRTGAPFQFLAITAMRSAETGTWTARAANTGVSAFIDGRGRVREQTRIFERDLLVGDVPLRRAGAAPTFYARHGDVFAWACWASLLGLGALGWRRGRRMPGAGDKA
jgi:apolipoprotein N-acyltransferase